jgi:hypothetical protein
MAIHYTETHRCGTDTLMSAGNVEHDHLDEFRHDPVGLMERLRHEGGDVVASTLHCTSPP